MAIYPVCGILKRERERENDNNDEQVRVVDLEASCARCPYRAECEASDSCYSCSVWKESMGDDL